MQYEDRYTALALSIIEHRGQQYVSIYDDPCPSFTVENRTDFNIYVAQSESVNVSKAANAIPECSIDCNFVWYQTVKSRQTVYYTPPVQDAIFPEAQETEVALIFACVSGKSVVFSTINKRALSFNIISGSAIRWSLPVKINENKNVFLNIPLYGDLKLAVNIKNRTTEIIIDYISQVICAQNRLKFELHFPFIPTGTRIFGKGHSNAVIESGDTASRAGSFVEAKICTMQHAAGPIG